MQTSPAPVPLPCLLLAAAITVAACAGAPPPPATAQGDAREGVTCVRDTGTRLRPSPPGRCLDQDGRSYDREAIDQSGATTAAGALRNLDPATR